MGYVEDLLSKDEVIIVRSRQHAIALLASALINGFIVVVVMGLRIFLGNFLPLNLPELVVTIMNVAAWLGVLYGVVRFGWDALRWWAEEYIVTNRRVIQSEGIVNKHTKDSSLEKVNDVELTQSVLGRILGYGDLSIVTGSDVGVNDLVRIREPIAFKTAMLDAKNDLEHSGGQRLPLGEPDDRDVPKLIAELDELRKRGVITEAEFNEKKAKLLSQL